MKTTVLALSLLAAHAAWPQTTPTTAAPDDDGGILLWRVVPANLHDPDFPTATFEAMVTKSLPRSVQVQENDTLSEVVRRHYNVSKTWTPAVYGVLIEQIKQAFQKWRHRSLALEEMAYLFLDGHYEGVRLGTKEKEAVLVIHGITKTGARRLLGLYLGCRESTDGWRLALEDLVFRKLSPPMLVISDGNPGLIRAVGEIWPGVPRQRCTVHRTRNVLARVPKKDHPRVSQSLNEIFYAPSLEESLAAARRFAGRWGNVYPEATTILGKDLSDCLTFFRFPPRHWVRLRTSNILERCFKEVKRRTRVIGRFPTEMSALSLIWSVMDENSKTWNGMIMDKAHQSLALAAIESLRKEPIVVRGFEELLAA